MSSISSLTSFGAYSFASPVRSVKKISSDDLPFLAPNRNNSNNSSQSQNTYKSIESTDSTGIVLSEKTKDFLSTLNANTSSSSSSVVSSFDSPTYTRTGNYSPNTVAVQTLSGSPTVAPRAMVAYSTGSNAVGGSSATLNSSAAFLTSSGTFTTSSTSIPQKPVVTSPDVDTEAGSRVREEKEKYPKIPNDSQQAEPVVSQELTAEDHAYVEELKKRDAEVRTHEQSHVSAGGGLTSGISYEYATGPDGQRYAVGGSVQIDTSPVPNDPDASIAKARKIRAAALAPASPSSQDRSVASAASQMESEARREKIAIAEEEKKAELEKQEEEKKLKEETELEEAQKAEEKTKAVEESMQSSENEPVRDAQSVVSVSDMNDVISDQTIGVSELIDTMSKEDESQEEQEPIFEREATSVGDISQNMSKSAVPAA